MAETVARFVRTPETAAAEVSTWNTWQVHWRECAQCMHAYCRDGSDQEFLDRSCDSGRSMYLGWRAAFAGNGHRNGRPGTRQD